MKHAIYPGSFDPPSLGHLDLIERGSRLFETVTIAIGNNRNKKSFFTLEERIQMLKLSTSHLLNVEIEVFSGLLVDYVNSKKTNIVIRGLRAITDFDYEFQIAMTNRKLSPDIETIFLMTSWEYSFVSSSIIKSVILAGGDYSLFVPKEIIEIINEKQIVLNVSS